MSTWFGDPAYYSRQFAVGQIAHLDSSRTADAARQAEMLRQYKTALGMTSDPRREETMLDRLKKFGRPDGEQARAAVDEMMELAAFGRSLAQEYDAQEIPQPKWLAESLSSLAREIKARHRAALEAELRKAQKDLDELKSREEKKTEKEAEVERLRKLLEG